ncbi:MAG: hypothetical protein K8T20_00620 [Planctomycetes bacterium]|nr:hypothetical protein [Planctomycetota bacterium]
MTPVEKPEAPAIQQPPAPPKDLVAAAIAAIATDAKSQPVEYVKATIVPGGGE